MIDYAEKSRKNGIAKANSLNGWSPERRERYWRDRRIDLVKEYEQAGLIGMRHAAMVKDFIEGRRPEHGYGFLPLNVEAG